MEQDTYRVSSNPLIAHGQNSRFNVLFAGESQTKPSHKQGPKVYDFYLMHMVLSGKGTFILNNKKHELYAGHTFLIEPEQLISYESDREAPWRYCWVAFNGTEAAELVEAAGFTANGQIAFLDDIRRASVLYRKIYDILRSGSAATNLYAAGYLQLLFAVYSEVMLTASRSGAQQAAYGEGEQLHQQIVHYLSTQYAHPVSIEQMSESLGYNRAYLSRIFKKQTGVSPVSFLLKLRMDKARHMLRERPELTIEQIAASVGLQDALYFSKQFRRLYGQSPTSYRQQFRG